MVSKYLKRLVYKFIDIPFFRRGLNEIVSFFAMHTKRDHSLIVFGAMNGNWYADNSMYVYKWILDNRKDLNPVWFTNNDEVYSSLMKKGMPVVKIWSFKALYLLSKSHCIFFTNSLKDFCIHPFLVHKNANLIALRHGRSVKRVRFARLSHQISHKEKLERLYESKLIKYAISTSTFISKLQEECLEIGSDKHVVTGYPRNDMLLKPTRSHIDVWGEFLNNLNFDKVVLYAPSWRHGRECTVFFPFDDFSITVLKSYLEENNILLLLRPHVGELSNSDLRESLISLCDNSKNISFAPHTVFPDINTILPFVDALISDYSALYHDYLLLDRPIIMIPYDYDTFNASNGFLYDYLSNMPGNSVSSLSELVYELDQVKKGNDLYKNKRTELRDKIHTYKDSESTQRVVGLVDRLDEL